MEAFVILGDGGNFLFVKSIFKICLLVHNAL